MYATGTSRNALAIATDSHLEMSAVSQTSKLVHRRRGSKCGLSAPSRSVRGRSVSRPANACRVPLIVCAKWTLVPKPMKKYDPLIGNWKPTDLDIDIKEGESLTIGREEDTDVVVPVPTISKQHAKVEVRDGDLYITDTGSLNGVYLGGKLLDPDSPTKLAAGDVVEFDTIAYTVAEVEAADESPADDPTERVAEAQAWIDNWRVASERTSRVTGAQAWIDNWREESAAAEKAAAEKAAAEKAAAEKAAAEKAAAEKAAAEKAAAEKAAAEKAAAEKAAAEKAAAEKAAAEKAAAEKAAAEKAAAEKAAAEKAAAEKAAAEKAAAEKAAAEKAAEKAAAEKAVAEKAAAEKAAAEKAAAEKAAAEKAAAEKAAAEKAAAEKAAAEKAAAEKAAADKAAAEKAAAEKAAAEKAAAEKAAADKAAAEKAAAEKAAAEKAAAEKAAAEKVAAQKAAAAAQKAAYEKASAEKIANQKAAAERSEELRRRTTSEAAKAQQEAAMQAAAEKLAAAKAAEAAPKVEEKAAPAVEKEAPVVAAKAAPVPPAAQEAAGGGVGAWAHKLGALALLVGLDFALKKAFVAAGIAFPSALAGMFAIIASLLALEALAPAAVTAIYRVMTPALDWIARWMPLFYVPSLIMLPIALQGISLASVSKIGGVVFFGFMVSLVFTAKIEGVLRSLMSSNAEAPPMPKAAASKGSPPSTVMAGWAAVGVASLALAVAGVVAPVTAAVPYLLAATVVSFLFGTTMSEGVKKVCHPLITCFLLTDTAAVVFGTATGLGWEPILRSFVRRSQDFTQMGGGDVLMFFLGSVILSFGFKVFDQRALIKRFAGSIFTTLIVSSLFSLFATAAIGAAIGLPGDLTAAITPRCVTVALALPIGALLGAGHQASITAAAVVLTGLVGANFAQALLDKLGVKDPITRGMATASSSHGLGTAALAGSEPEALPFAALSYALMGIISTLLLAIPPIRVALLALCGM